jgi:hypothetical protein
MNPENSDKLETSIHRALRNLPDRKAPAGLEARILAEIGRRASLPWWRKSFTHWPSAVRAGFFVCSGLAAAALVAGLFVLSQSPGAHEVSSAISSARAWIIIARDLFNASGAKARSLLAAIPALWLYGGAATIALCYAAVAAAGAATYRALSVGRQAT